MPALTKNEMRPTTCRSRPRRSAGLCAPRPAPRWRWQRVGQFLHRRRARFLQVVATDVGRVPLGNVLDRVGDDVGGQPQRGRRREDVGAARQIFLDDVVLGGALQLRGGLRPAVGGGDVQRQQPGGGGVDGHRGVHLPQRNPVEQRLHVADVPIGTPTLPTSPRARDDRSRNRSGSAGRRPLTGRSDLC
jgi:hypothetical protein